MPQRCQLRGEGQSLTVVVPVSYRVLTVHRGSSHHAIQRYSDLGEEI